MLTFAELAASRRAWIDDVLRPWCLAARRAELIKAEQEWNDIAGRVDADRTLWLWAWSRFPCLYVDGLGGLEESWPVRVVLRNGQSVRGYPDNRMTGRGELYLTSREGAHGPFVIDDIVEITRVDD